MNYWIGELANKAPATKEKYKLYFLKFSTYIGKTPNELLTQRKQDVKSDDIMTQRRIETALKTWIAELTVTKNKEVFPASTATKQIGFAAVRSFFEMNYLPLKMRHGDYPTGQSLGSRVITTSVIRKILDDSEHTRLRRKVKALVLFLKDTGFRVSDAVIMNYGTIADGLERGDLFIPIQIITKKNKTTAKTFIGPEAIEAIKEYLAERRKGSQRRLNREYIHPEVITKSSPLFRTNERGSVKRMSRGGLSNMLNFHCQRTGEKKLSAHSFRKNFQTQLESAGVSPNWIDQMIGHKLINSRDAYSLPSDEQLLGVYQKAYSRLRVYPEKQEIEARILSLENEVASRNKTIADLLSNGHQKTSEIEQLQDMYNDKLVDIAELQCNEHDREIEMKTMQNTIQYLAKTVKDLQTSVDKDEKKSLASYMEKKTKE